MRMMRWLFVALVLIVAGVPVTATAAVDETLMIIVPRASGTTPVVGRATLNSNHYTLHAYPAVEYRMRVAARGGTWPYTYAITAGPAGLVVDSSTGVISWPNPTTSGSPHNATVRVTDALGAQVSSSWTITVATSKFIFVDCDVAGPGTGTIGDPYKTVGDFTAARPAHVNKIVYFRACASNYTINLTPNSSDRRDFHGCCDPMQWIVYPGESATMDIGYQQGVTDGIHFRFSAGPAALIGFTCTNVKNKCINTVDGMAYITVNDNVFNLQSGVNGQNPGYWQTELGNGSDFSMFMGNDCSNFGPQNGGSAGTCVKFYAQKYLLIADNHIHDSVGSSNIQGIDLKGSLIEQAWVRNNHCHDVYAHCIGGSHFTLADSVFEFNRIYNCGINCFVVNEAGVITTPIKIRRNTIVGRWDIEDVIANSGPFILENNVHIATDTLDACIVGQRIVCPPDNAGADETRIQVAASPNDNLVRQPSDNCVDANGLLTDAGADDCLTNYGPDSANPKGAETSASTPPPPSPPNPPTNLQVVDTPGDTGTQLNLTWTVSVSAGVTAQRVYRSEVSGSGYALVTTFNNNSTAAYTDTLLTPLVSYYYVLRAYNGTTALESVNSVEANGVPVNNPVPPTSVPAASGSGIGQQ